MDFSSSSNRTIVGLKPVPLKLRSHCRSCSNRTIVGLKHCLCCSHLSDSAMQQSHHCGIETQPTTPSKFIPTKQQSHHCGIETARGQMSQVLLVSSNRTIVGLKLGSTNHDWSNWVGSNRTIVGLKPRLPKVYISSNILAAIAPLWD